MASFELGNVPRNDNANTNNNRRSGSDDLSQSVNSEMSATPQKEKTIVSFVLDENTAESDEQEEKKNKSKSSRSRIGILYAIVVTLIGIAFPVTEALRDAWLTDWAAGAFLLYLYGLSSIFLVYIMIRQIRRGIREKRRKERKEQNENEAHDNNGFQPGAGEVVVARRKSVGGDLLGGTATPQTPGGRSLLHHGLDSTPSSMSLEDNPDLKHLYLATRRMSKAALGGTQMSKSSSHSHKPNLDGGEDQATVPNHLTSNYVDDADYDEDELVEYINVRTQTASLGHEGTSLYLRLGCILFGIANLVYVCMEIEYYQGGHISPDCPDFPVVYPMYCHLIFLVIQTFFLFKNTTLHEKQQKGFIRVGLMHLLATNLCVWARFLVREVQEGVHGHHFSTSDTDEIPYADTNDNVTSPCYDGDSLLKEASPYLFPFVLEYSLIAMATYAGMYAGLDVKVSKDLLKSVKESLMGSGKSPDARDGEADDSVESAGHGDHGGHGGLTSFGKAHRGLFVGMLFLAGIVISVVLFYYNLRNQKSQEAATLIYHASDLILNAVLIIAVIIGLVYFFRMGFSSERVNTIDNTLLVVSFAGLFLLEIFVIISDFVYITEGDYDDVIVMDVTAGLMSVIQAILQTIFICDGLQRYALTKHQEVEKPGRGTVCFLIIVNVGMWIFKTFMVKESGLGRQEDFFGETPWRIILNISLPLMLFFRFHSSVCLADMYGESFKPQEKPVAYSYLS